MQITFNSNNPDEVQEVIRFIARLNGAAIERKEEEAPTSAPAPTKRGRGRPKKVEEAPVEETILEVEPIEVPEEVEEPEPEQEATPADYDDVRQAVHELVAAKGVPAAKQVLTSLGAKKVGDLPADRLDEALAALKEATHA